ncbi:hypothetical protein KKG90_09785 [Candidatus Bipolaricaulota bacterium]|nr:hypothetical protein [Candidatus Bipolaricaulota bacterium]
MVAKRWMTLVLACLIGLLLSTSALTQEASQVPVNVSEGRSWGIGMQAGLPYGGLISVRSWLWPTIGLEGIVFLNGGAYNLDGTVTMRALFRANDATMTDFYVVAGATLPLEGRTLVISLMGGFEFGFRLAPMLAWNLEFGASYALDGYYNMTIGTGLHYYFPRKQEIALEF